MNKSGFTLIELILVTVIIGILAGMVVINFSGRAHESKVRAAKGDIASYGTAIELFALDKNDKVPASLEELANDPRGYLKNGLRPDPWGNNYVYTVNGTKYTVTSAGPDGQAGTADDVTSTSAITQPIQETN